MKKFFVPVDMSDRQAMVDYLTGHFRYNTANSWNGSTSYACDLKLGHLDLPADTESSLFDMLYTDELAEERESRIQAFDAAHNWKWQAGMNGRSGGYLVLYQGGRRATEHKSVCTFCGQKNFTSVKTTGARCGRCGRNTRIDFAEPPMQSFTYPMRGTDMDEDFEDFSMAELRERVRVVQALDKLADAIVEAGVYMVDNYELQEEEYTVVQTRTVLLPK